MKKFMKTVGKVVGWLGGRSRSGIFAACIAVVGLVALADYFLGRDFTSSLFYLLPIVVVTWFVGTRAGVALSVLSTALNTLNDVLLGLEFSRAVAVWNAIVPLFFFLLFVALLSLLKAALGREEKLSRTDPLTGLLNRRYFYELGGMELERARRYRHPLTLAYLDLDNFKEVNDTLGHEVGDEVLEQTASLFHENLREIDVIARLGGDEFAVLLPEAEAVGGALAVAKLRDRFLAEAKRRAWPVSLSIGLVTWTEPPETVDAMLSEADALMYSVKNSGKNAIRQEVL